MCDSSDELSRSLGLTRSYSEHANFLLQQYRRHPSPCSRSFEEEDEFPDTRSEGQLTWKISTSEDEDHTRVYCHKFSNLNYGDSDPLTTEFSELSLAQPSITTPITSYTSVERHCTLFHDDEIGYSSDYPLYLEQSRRYNSEDNTQNERLKHPSASSTSLKSHQRLKEKKKKPPISYDIWAREKKFEEQRRKNAERRTKLKQLKREEDERRKREEQERRDNECVLKWAQSKREQLISNKQLMDKERELQQRILDIENRAKLINEISVRQWHAKKELQLQKEAAKELMRQKLAEKKAEEEKQKQLQENEVAYEKWCQKAKSTPRPATQGLLPHQKAKPAFTNPTPWQPLIHVGSDNSDTEKETKTSISKPTKSQRAKSLYVKG